MENKKTLRGSETVRDLDGQTEDLRQLMLLIRSFREQLEDFEKECHKKINEQMCTLEGLLSWCDDLLSRSSELYREHTQENDIPED